MSRGLKPNRQILNNWVNQLQRENKALKHEVAIHAARGMILERIVKDRLGLSVEDLTKAMMEVARNPEGRSENVESEKIA